MNSLATESLYANRLHDFADNLESVSQAGQMKAMMDRVDNLWKATVNGGAWLPVALGGGGAGVSMQGAYDGAGGAGTGLGRTLSVMNGGAVQFLDSSATGNNVFNVQKTPVGAQTGNAIDVQMGANANGGGVVITRQPNATAYSVGSGALIINQQTQRQPSALFRLRNLSKVWGIAEFWDTVGAPYILDGATDCLVIDGRGGFTVDAGTVDALTNNVQFRNAIFRTPATTAVGTRGVLVDSLQRAGAGIEVNIAPGVSSAPTGFLATMGANATGNALTLTHSGTGAGITVQAITSAGTGASVGHSITMNGNAGTTGQTITSAPSASQATAALRIAMTNKSVSGIGIQVSNAAMPGSFTYGRLDQLLEVNTTANYGGAAWNTWSATAVEGALIDFNRSASATIGTMTSISTLAGGGANTRLGSFVFRGSNGTSFVDGAAISAFTDAATGVGNDMPGRLSFLTSLDGTATLSERVRIGNQGVVTLNTGVADTASYTPNSRLGQLLEININSGDYGGMAINNWGSTLDNGPLLDLNRSASTSIGSFAAVASGARLGTIAGRGADGAAFRDASAIEFRADATATAGSMPGRIQFYTTPSGSVSVLERVRINSSGVVTINSGVSTTLAYTPFTRLGQLLEVNTTANSGGAAISTWSTTASQASQLDLNRSKSATIGTLTTAVASGDALGSVAFRGTNNSAFIEGAQIQGFVDAAPGATDMPGRLIFGTTATGATTTTERMRITSAGLVGVNMTPTNQFDVTNSSADTTAGIGITRSGAAVTTGISITNTSGSGIGQNTAVTPPAGTAANISPVLSIFNVTQTFTGSTAFNTGSTSSVATPTGWFQIIHKPTWTTGAVGATILTLQKPILEVVCAETTGNVNSNITTSGALLNLQDAPTTHASANTLTTSKSGIVVNMAGTQGVGSTWTDTRTGLSVTMTPPASSAVVGQTITMGANSTGAALAITQSGSGAGITVSAGGINATGTITLPSLNSAGGLLVASGAGVLSQIADVATGSVLVSGGVGANPSYSASPTLTTSLTTPLVIGGTAVGSTLTLRSTSAAGSTDAIIFNTGSQVERARIDSAGIARVNNSGTAIARLGQLFEVNTTANFGGVTINTWSATPGENPLIDICRSKGATVGTYTAVLSTEALGAISWRGATGSAFATGAFIQCVAEENFSATAVGTRMVFATTANTTTTNTERMRIDNAGVVNVGGTSTSVARIGQLIETHSANFGGFSMTNWSSTAGNNILCDFNRSKSGTIGTYTAVANGDALGALVWRGANNTGTASFADAAYLQVFVDAAVSGGGVADMPARFVFSVSADGSATPSERLRISNTGTLGVTPGGGAGVVGIDFLGATDGSAYIRGPTGADFLQASGSPGANSAGRAFNLTATAGNGNVGGTTGQAGGSMTHTCGDGTAGLAGGAGGIGGDHTIVIGIGGAGQGAGAGARAGAYTIAAKVGGATGTGTGGQGNAYDIACGAGGAATGNGTGGAAGTWIFRAAAGGASATTGAQNAGAASVFQVNAAAGGALTGVGATGTAGKGSTFTLVCGDGGAASAAGATNGAGGDFNLNIGQPGGGAGVAGTQGQFAVRTSGSVNILQITQNSLIGFFNVTAVARQSLPNALTDSTTGTPSDTINDGGAAYSQTVTNNNNASMLRKVNQIRTALLNYGLLSS